MLQYVVSLERTDFMKEDLLKDFRKEYNTKMQEKKETYKRLEVLMTRKSILENNQLVKDYIDLCKQIEIEEENMWLTDEIFVETLYDFENKGLVDETNGIYLYLGTFYTEYGCEMKVKRDDNAAEFDKYIDIESCKEIHIPVEDRTAFEKNNKVIFVEGKEHIKYLLFDLHEQFMHDALDNGQEVACNNVLRRYKKN